MADLTSVDDHLKCSICLEFYSNPRRLPCDHVFCSMCLEGLSRKSQSFACPECREKVKLGVKGIHDLRQDRKLESIVNSVQSIQKKAAQQRYNECGAHGKVADIYCKTCKILVCSKCSFGGEHHSHVLIEIENASQIEKKNLSEQKQRILHCMEKLSQSEDMVRRNADNIRNKADGLLKQLRNTFAILRDELDGKEEELEKRIEHEVSSNETKTYLAVAQLQKLKENFKECLQHIDACTDDSTVLKNSAEISDRNAAEFENYDSAKIPIPRSKSVTKWKELEDVQLNVSQTIQRFNDIPDYTEDDNIHLAKKVFESTIYLDENLIKYFRKSLKHKEKMNCLAKDCNCTILWDESISNLHLRFEKYFESEIECFQNRLAIEKEQYDVKKVVVDRYIWKDMMQRLKKVTTKSPDDTAVLVSQNSVVCVGLRQCVRELHTLICHLVNESTREAQHRSSKYFQITKHVNR